MSAPEIVVRSARAGDAEHLVQLHYDAVHEGAKAAYPQQVLDSWSPPPGESRVSWMRGQIEAESRRVLVAEAEGNSIAGFCMISPADGVVHALYVSPGRMGNGIGRRLLRLAEGMIAEWGTARVSLNASKNAMAFYASEGYRTVAAATQQLFDGSRMDCCEMVKELPPAAR